MINVRIYCHKLHREYEATFNVINEALKECGLEYQIRRITDNAAFRYLKIFFQPHIVINNQVVYNGSCPKPEEVRIILQRMGLLKQNPPL